MRKLQIIIPSLWLLIAANKLFAQVDSRAEIQDELRLSRAMQITRITHGLYTQDQLPFLYKKIENYANQGNWDKARKHMGYLQWLYQSKPMRGDEDLLNRLLQFSDFHVRAVVEESADLQSFHILEAAKINWMALSLAERIWGKTDPNRL